MHGVVMRKGGCVRAYVRGVRTWAWPGRVRARVRAHVLTRVRAPELTNIPLHMRRRQHFFLGRAERQRWGLELAGTLVRGDRSVRPSVRFGTTPGAWTCGRVGLWVCGCVCLWCGFLCRGQRVRIRISKFLGLSYNKVHQGKWPCAARLIFLWRHSITAREADLP